MKSGENGEEIRYIFCFTPNDVIDPMKNIPSGLVLPTYVRVNGQDKFEIDTKNSKRKKIKAIRKKKGMIIIEYI